MALRTIFDWWLEGAYVVSQFIIIIIISAIKNVTLMSRDTYDKNNKETPKTSYSDQFRLKRPMQT